MPTFYIEEKTATLLRVGLSRDIDPTAVTLFEQGIAQSPYVEDANLIVGMPNREYPVCLSINCTLPAPVIMQVRLFFAGLLVVEVDRPKQESVA